MKRKYLTNIYIDLNCFHPISGRCLFLLFCFDYLAYCSFVVALNCAKVVNLHGLGSMQFVYICWVLFDVDYEANYMAVRRFYFLCDVLNMWIVDWIIAAFSANEYCNYNATTCYKLHLRSRNTSAHANTNIIAEMEKSYVGESKHKIYKNKTTSI